MAVLARLGVPLPLQYALGRLDDVLGTGVAFRQPGGSHAMRHRVFDRTIKHGVDPPPAARPPPDRGGRVPIVSTDAPGPRGTPRDRLPAPRRSAPRIAPDAPVRSGSPQPWRPPTSAATPDACGSPE